VHVHDDGSSGTLDCDVKYKTTPAGAWNTIFSTTGRPTVTFGGGNDIISTNGVLSVTDLDGGWFIKLDIITAQGNNEFFNVYLGWEAR
jgi:hypothetical protein